MNSGKHLLQEPSGEKPGPQPSQELPSPSPSPTEAFGQRGAQSSSQQVLETQDWVSEPPGAPRRSRHWSLSIEERRQRAEQDAAGPSAQCPDVLQAVAQLVSDDVDKDVLVPHPAASAASAASARAFRAFLARAAREPRS